MQGLSTLEASVLPSQCPGIRCSLSYLMHACLRREVIPHPLLAFHLKQAYILSFQPDRGCKTLYIVLPLRRVLWFSYFGQFPPPVAT
jgi:hypothetical protein|uniref:Uncharacterized protein n=1 Tax=Picea glauca TaxID=3330 RepID=A0A101M4A9_PICGL|nr:hypothetical protein ABT39_MTgene557 [Picea glauca]QHR89386.1 hypothetical protein Q903MT_gene3407 [Picea sitchensis]